MRKNFTKYSLVLLATLGCSGGDNARTSSIVTVEEMSSYDYDYYSGQNAAVRQFGSDNDSDLIVNLDNKRVLSYASDSDHHGYADGYHKALDIIDSRNNQKCPDLH